MLSLSRIADLSQLQTIIVLISAIIVLYMTRWFYGKISFFLKVESITNELLEVIPDHHWIHLIVWYNILQLKSNGILFDFIYLYNMKLFFPKNLYGCVCFESKAFHLDSLWVNILSFFAEMYWVSTVISWKSIHFIV